MIKNKKRPAAIPCSPATARYQSTSPANSSLRRSARQAASPPPPIRPKRPTEERKFQGWPGQVVRALRACRHTDQDRRP